MYVYRSYHYSSRLLAEFHILVYVPQVISLKVPATMQHEGAGQKMEKVSYNTAPGRGLE